MRRLLAALALSASIVALAPALAAAAPVRLTVLHLVDGRRMIELADGRRVARPLTTYVRYPAGAGRHPLIVFAHGFAVSPATYARLLDAWAAHGYVVAAPVFPLTSSTAPGGPREGDIVNEPRDMSVVISDVIRGTLGGRVERSEVAVAGHSDGAIVALATAFDQRLRDRRVRAAVVMSGAAIRPFSAFASPPLPALLAAQGTGDTTNAPTNTYGIFGGAPHPKYLLKLLGAQHLPPFTAEQPQLGIVERVSVAFFDAYLKHRRGALRRLRRAGAVAGRATLVAG